eukprot:TRINITY_DN31084_c0_g1_i1.p1 TRINITY_DN31084_c0_g1~~TRINITY_DN31084_c0_g1_i1.p1  ORF type:complete len:164 (+),score=7.44 TRINITY_DN31084_c0_g1_i1:193-684(+)
MASAIPNPPAVIEYKNWRFFLCDAPNDANLDIYLQEFLKHHVVQVVRACAPSYSTEKLLAKGILVQEMPFQDGGTPSDETVERWLALCRETFKKESEDTIGVHCVAGLGRAPVLVSIALLERGLKFEEAVELIRQKRRGAINQKQLKFLREYRPKKKGDCVIA